MKNLISLLLGIMFFSGCIGTGKGYRIREYESIGIVEVEHNGKMERYHKVYYPSLDETVLYPLD